MKYLIVEDEALARDELSRMLGRIDEQSQIVGATASVAATVEWLRTHDMPDLIFMDIHLEDDICFGIFDAIDVTAPVLFTTAYDQYALRAFNANGVGYLLKPYDEQELSRVLGRLFRFSGRVSQEQIERVVESMSQIVPGLGHGTAATSDAATDTDAATVSDADKAADTADAFDRPEPLKRLSLHIGDGYESLPIEQVAYFYSEDHYTFVVSRDGRRCIINPPLEDIEPRLSRERFFRVARNCIVSIEAVTRVSRHINGRLRLHVRPEHKSDFFVSRARVRDFLRWMGMS